MGEGWCTAAHESAFPSPGEECLHGGEGCDVPAGTCLCSYRCDARNPENLLACVNCTCTSTGKFRQEHHSRGTLAKHLFSLPSLPLTLSIELKHHLNTYNWFSKLHPSTRPFHTPLSTYTVRVRVHYSNILAVSSNRGTA